MICGLWAPQSSKDTSSDILPLFQLLHRIISIGQPNTKLFIALFPKYTYPLPRYALDYVWGIAVISCVSPNRSLWRHDMLLAAAVLRYCGIVLYLFVSQRFGYAIYG